MYAQVVVLTYQSPEIDSYTYEVPKKLEGLIKSGQLVEVPFGSRNPMGIVIDVSNHHPGVATTTIGSKDSIAEFILNKRNRSFAVAQDDKSEGLQNDKIIIKPISSLVFPTPLILPYQIKLLKWLSFYYHAPMVNCLEAILPELLSSQFTVHSPQNKKEKSVNRQPSTVNQTLVLVPTINRLPETLAKFPTAKNYVLYHAEQKPKERFATWLKILEGRIDFVFGSRSAIFTACPKLSKIIIFDEHDGAYKDERSPYFDTLTIAEKLQSLTDAKLQIIDISPKISTYFSHKNDIQIPKSKIQTTIVSMTEERNKGNKSAISDLLSSLLIKIVNQDKKVLLFLNKKRESGQIYCKTCRFHEFALKAPQVCPNCQSMDFYFNSLNIWSLTENIKQIVSKASINLIAEGIRHPISDIPASPSGGRHPVIDIATASVFYRLSAQKYNLVAHILTDTALNVADFNSSEKTFAQITALKNLAAKDGRLILQTYNTDHPVIKNAAKSNFLSYFAQNLSERKALSFPPFAMLIKLTVKGQNNEKNVKMAEELIAIFKKIDNPKVIVLGPYESIFSTKVPACNIILKHKLNSYEIIEREKARQNLEEYLGKVSRDWQITIEPASLN